MAQTLRVFRLRVWGRKLFFNFHFRKGRKLFVRTAASESNATSIKKDDSSVGAARSMDVPEEEALAH